MRAKISAKVFEISECRDFSPVYYIAICLLEDATKEKISISKLYDREV